jgi:hypothetical protein
MPKAFDLIDHSPFDFLDLGRGEGTPNFEKNLCFHTASVCSSHRPVDTANRDLQRFRLPRPSSLSPRRANFFNSSIGCALGPFDDGPYLVSGN